MNMMKKLEKRRAEYFKAWSDCTEESYALLFDKDLEAFERCQLRADLVYLKYMVIDIMMQAVQLREADGHKIDSREIQKIKKKLHKIIEESV